MPYPRENLRFEKAAPAANKVAKAETAEPEGNMRIRVDTVIASYSGKPTNGLLKITDGTQTIEHDLPTEGLVVLEPGLTFTAGATVTVELAAGGGEVKGKVTVIYTVE